MQPGYKWVLVVTELSDIAVSYFDAKKSARRTPGAHCKRSETQCLCQPRCLVVNQIYDRKITFHVNLKLDEQK